MASASPAPGGAHGGASPAKFDVDGAAIKEAAARIAGLVRATPAYHSPALSAHIGRETWIKLEGLQVQDALVCGWRESER